MAATPPDWRPPIYAYIDFRAYLGAYYDAAKAHSKVFSYRWFSRQAGFSSPNFLKLVIDGKRNLGAESVDRFAEALRLPETERRFFADLVAFGQAETDDERQAAYERVAASRNYRQSRRIDVGLYEYLSHWYYPVIREMTARPDFDADPAWIARRLVPRVSPREVLRALRLLEELGLIVRGDDGRLERGEPSLHTGHEVQTLAARTYHRQMLERAAGSMELVPQQWRDLSALTVCVSADRVPELKRRMHEFQEVMLQLCDAPEDSAPQIVYQINMQLFPFTRVDGGHQ